MSSPVGEPSVTIHSSWRGIVGSALGAAILTVGGVAGVAQAGFRAVPAGLLALGGLFLLGVAFDYPIASTFTASGVQRRMLLRRQFIAWNDTCWLTRTRPSIVASSRRREAVEVLGGGLVLKHGRRRYLLADQLENGFEFDQLATILEPVDGEIGIDSLRRPTETRAPTWIYRRRRWRPDSTGDR